MNVGKDLIINGSRPLTFFVGQIGIPATVICHDSSRCCMKHLQKKIVKRIIKRTRNTMNVIIIVNGGAEYGNGGGDSCDDEFCMELVDISVEESKAKRLS